MTRRLIVGTLAGAAVLGAVAPSFAAVSSPVTVRVSTTNGVGVGAGAFGQPLVGASASGTTVCVGVSYQVPVCA